MSMKKLSPIITFGVVLVLLALSGCATQPDRLWLKAPGWSRARVIGQTRVNAPVPLAVDDSGHVHIVLVASDETDRALRLVQLDERARVVLDRTYPQIALNQPGKTRAVWDGESLQIFWLESGGLYHAGLAQSGEMQTGPMLLSRDHLARDFAVAQGGKGALAVWYAGNSSRPGLYAITLGNPNPEPVLVDGQGSRPNLQFDQKGDLHALWTRNPTGQGEKPFIYGHYPQGLVQTGLETIVDSQRLVGTMVMRGPTLGLEAENAYVFWSLTWYSGPNAGNTEARYIYFPHGEPGQSSPLRLLTVPFDYNLPYQEEPEGGLLAGDRVPLSQVSRGGTRFILRASSNPELEPELVIATEARMAYLMRKAQVQVNAVYLQDGAPKTYQLLSFTSGASSQPGLISDADGFLHLTWLEKGDLPGWAIYYASTVPATRSGLSGLTLDDLGRLTADTVFGFVSGAMLIPLALAWIAPALIVLLLTSGLRRGQEGLRGPGAFLSMGVALLVLWFIKLNFLPGMRTYLPFSAWWPSIPTWLEAPLQFGTPLMIAALALFGAQWIVRRRKSDSMFVFILLYAVVDALMTMGVYGVLIFSAF